MPEALKSHADSIREILRDELECTAEWRRQKAEEYPDDERNLEAAALLDRIAATVDEIDDSIAEAYSELFEDAPDSERFSEMLRHVGFDSAPESAVELVKNFIADRTGG